jgi:hypothetical protein
MIGGLLKSTSRLALVAAAGLFVGGVAMPSAKAADLGGDCCADLEERVAELEATTARKGNRKMSLTVTGQVHRAVIWYDDGHSSTTYYGVDSTNASSRFIFTGSARVTPSVTMGFEIMIEIEAGGTSSKLNQFDEDGKVGGGIGGTASFNQHNVDAYFGDARRAAWWIEHKDLGRMTVGRWDAAGVLSTIDLTGHLFLGASSSFILLNGGFFIRGPGGEYYSTAWNSIGDPASASSGRTELVRYDSPVWHGFILASFVAEAGDYWGSHIRYAGEHGGIRIAGSIGYERVTDIATPTAISPADPAFTGARPDITVWGGALSFMHVPTGLFIQGHYNTVDYGDIAPGAPSGYWGQGAQSAGSLGNKRDTSHWFIQGGITKNWFGYGNTTVYGEYGQANDWGANTLGRNFAVAGFTAVNGVTDTELNVWGFGIAQNIDAAATALYLGYRHMEADIGCNTVGCVANAGTGATVGKLATEDIDVIVMGARVLF